MPKFEFQFASQAWCRGRLCKDVCACCRALQLCRLADGLWCPILIDILARAMSKRREAPAAAVSCELCNKSFRSSHGLKIHETSAAHLARQRAVGADAQSNNTNTGAAQLLASMPAVRVNTAAPQDHQTDSGHEVPGLDDSASVEPQPAMATSEPAQAHMHYPAFIRNLTASSF